MIERKSHIREKHLFFQRKETKDSLKHDLGMKKETENSVASVRITSC